MRELVAANVLVVASGGWAFRQTLLQQGIYETTNTGERLELHRAALAYWRARGDDPEIHARVARHAEAAGQARLAAQAYAKLAQHAHREHRALDADQAWQSALDNLHIRDAARGRALLGRARARYRLQRVRDALADLDEARGIAGELGDTALEIETLLEQATALDWGDDYASSSAIAERAATKLEATPVTALEIELGLARGRSEFRAGKFAAAVPTLRAVMTAATGESEIVAGVLLAPSLVEIGELDAAEEVFAQMIQLCEARGDRFHLGACYANRAWLWSARGEVDRTASDLRVVIQVAREIGQATLERIGTYNLAEDRLWQGSLEEALHLARRSLAIQRGHGEGTERWDQLLVARILAAFGDRAGELASLLDVLEAGELDPGDRAMVRVLRCAAGDHAADEWRNALDDGDSILPLDRRLELAHLAIRRGMLPAERRDQVRELATRHPIWLRRLDEL
jgi:tetratricopeptide (TPR) repeat protein